MKPPPLALMYYKSALEERSEGKERSERFGHIKTYLTKCYKYWKEKGYDVSEFDSLRDDYNGNNRLSQRS